MTHVLLFSFLFHNQATMTVISPSVSIICSHLFSPINSQVLHPYFHYGNACLSYCFKKVASKSPKKGQPGALKLPHTQGPGRGPTIWCIVRSLTLFLHKRLFPGLEPVTFQSHDNNFTSCTKVITQGKEIIRP
jgi:hypothetical protein